MGVATGTSSAHAPAAVQTNGAAVRTNEATEWIHKQVTATCIKQGILSGLGKLCSMLYPERHNLHMKPTVTVECIIERRIFKKQLNVEHGYFCGWKDILDEFGYKEGDILRFKVVSQRCSPHRFVVQVARDSVTDSARRGATPTDAYSGTITTKNRLLSKSSLHTPSRSTQRQPGFTDSS